MSTINDCLSKIIGLSETNCSCFTSGIPVDAATSNSGLFLDQLEGLNLKMADAIEDCEEGGLWDILAKSRDNGIKDFRSDLQSALLTKYRLRRQPFTGIIGSTAYKNNLTLTGTYAGVEFFMDQVIGGVMEIRRIGLLFAESAPIDITIYSNVDDSVIATYSTNTVANTLTWYDLPTPLSLEQSNESGSYPRYYVLFTSAGNTPKDIQAGCGCSNKVYHFYWNCKEPKFKSYEKDRWSEFLMIRGVQGNDLTDRENWATSQYMNGLLFDVTFKCRVKDLICTEQMDYENNVLAMAMAYAVRLKAGTILLDKILASGAINRYTMMDRERIMGKKNTYMKEYKNYIEWLAEQINYKANDCLICNDMDDIFKAGIFA